MLIALFLLCLGYLWLREVGGFFPRSLKLCLGIVSRVMLCHRLLPNAGVLVKPFKAVMIRQPKFGSVISNLQPYNR